MKTKYKLTQIDVLEIKDIKKDESLCKKIVDKHLDILVFDNTWSEELLENHKEKIESAGFYNVRILYSGFGSQGDGAMFEYDSISRELFEEFVESSILDLTKEQKHILLNDSDYGAFGEHWGHYYHKNSCKHFVTLSSDEHKWVENLCDLFGDFVKDSYQDLCFQLYAELSKFYFELISEEAILEYLENEDFTYEVEVSCIESETVSDLLEKLDNY
jgi:hypothetical protein